MKMENLIVNYETENIDNLMVLVVILGTFMLVALSLIHADINNDTSKFGFKDMFLSMLGSMFLIFIYSTPFLFLLSIFWNI
tara:strand:+ start:412 stop:654 length:243 start_codon:yes stop_codon:yes gene_type:complete